MIFSSLAYLFRLTAIAQSLLFSAEALQLLSRTARMGHAPCLLNASGRKRSKTSLFSRPPIRKLSAQMSQSDRRTHILKSAVTVLSQRTGIELTLLEEFRKFTVGLGGQHSTVPVPFGKVIYSSCDVGKQAKFGLSVDELVDLLEAGACVLLVVYNPTSMDFPFVYFMSPDHLQKFQEAIEESGIDGSTKFYPRPYGSARSGLSLLMECYRHSLEDNSNSLRDAMTKYAASTTCRKETLSFLNSDLSMDGAVENMIEKRKKENPKGTGKNKVQLRESIAAFSEYLGWPMKELAECSKYGVFFGTDNQQAAPYGRLVACNYRTNGRVNFNTQMGDIVDLLSDGGCVILLVLNASSGSFDYAYCLTPDELPKLKQSINDHGIKESSNYHPFPGSLPNKGSVSLVMNGYKYAFNDSRLTNKLLNFTSAQETRRETSRFLNTDRSMVPSVNDQIANACRALVLKFFPGAEERTTETGRGYFVTKFIDSSEPTLATHKATPNRSSRDESGYYTRIRTQTGLVMDTEEMSALAVVMPRNNTDEKEVVTSPDHYGTIVLLATRTTDGRVALGGTNIGKQIIHFTWNAEQRCFSIKDNMYNRSPGDEKDWVVLTIPDSSDPEYEAKMAAVLSLARETLAAFASRPQLTAAEKQKGKRSVDFNEEGEKNRIYKRGYRKTKAHALRKVSQQIADEEATKRKSKRTTRVSAGPQEVVMPDPPCVGPPCSPY